MKYWKLEMKFKGSKNFSLFATYKEPRTPIKNAKELIKENIIEKVRVNEVEENTIYEEEAE